MPDMVGVKVGDADMLVVDEAVNVEDTVGLIEKVVDMVKDSVSDDVVEIDSDVEELAERVGL
jgi:hypothetical protein